MCLVYKLAVVLFQTLALTVLFQTVYCAAVVPGISDNVFYNEESDIPNSDVTDATRSFSPFVEPTVASSEGEAVTNEITPINNMVTDNGAGQPKPGAKVETPKEVSNWLQALRDLEIKSNILGIKARGGNSEMTPTESLPSLKRGDIELPSPDQLFKWLDSIPPLYPDTLQSGDKSSQDNGIVSKTNAPHLHTVDKLDVYTHTSKLVLMICVPVGVVLLCLILITIYIVYKNRLSAKKQAESKLTVLGSVNRNPDVFNVEGKDNVFMGIPANNQIWKELQMLPSTASSVLPESKSV